MEEKKKKSAPPTAKKKKKPVKKSPAKKKKPARQEDDLPLWLIRIVDGFADLFDRLKTLPGRFVKLMDSWFYRVYFPLVLVAIIAICFGFRWLRGFAADYEASQPAHVAEEITRMFENGEYDRLYAMDTAAQTVSNGDPAFYGQTLSGLIGGGKLEFSESYASGSDALEYNITLNGSRFATFTLVPSGQKTAHNNTIWTLGTLTTQLVLRSEIEAQDPKNAPCRVQAPEGYVVTVDGRQLTEADVVRTGVAIYPDDFLPSGVTAPTLTEYGFTPEGDAPNLTVADASGAQTTVRETSENIWVASLWEDPAVRQRYAETVTSLAQRIAKYTTADISQSSALKSVIGGSPAETTLKAFKNDWAPSHKSERFEDMAITDFCRLSDDCITCHVKFNYILTSRRQNDYPYETEYTFCIVTRGGEAKLYNLMFH